MDSKGTHRFEKFIKPEEIKKCLESYNLKLKNIKGLVFNPINYAGIIRKYKNKLFLYI